MKRGLVNFLITITVLVCLFTFSFGCFGTYKDVSSGDKIEFSNLTEDEVESYFSKIKFTHDEDRSGDIYTKITFKGETKGYSGYSYYNCSVYCSIEYSYLSDSGSYLTANDNISIDVSSNGSGSTKKSVTVGYRNVTDFKFSFTVSGYVVKK